MLNHFSNYLFEINNLEKVEEKNVFVNENSGDVIILTVEKKMKIVFTFSKETFSSLITLWMYVEIGIGAINPAMNVGNSNFSTTLLCCSRSYTCINFKIAKFFFQPFQL